MAGTSCLDTFFREDTVRYPHILRSSLSAASLCALLAACATSPQMTAWNLAKQVNTPKAYQDFVKRYPKSMQAKDAQRKLAKSRWEKAEKQNSVISYIKFAEENPKSTKAKYIEKYVGKAALATDDPRECYAFLKRFPKHKDAEQVRARVEELEYQTAKNDSSPLATELFLMKFPDSQRAAEIRKGMASKAYKQVSKWDSPLGYHGFLNLYKKSRYSEEVREAAGRNPKGGSPKGLPGLLDKVREKSPMVAKHACGLLLSQKLQTATGPDADGVRMDIDELGYPGAEKNLPSACSDWGEITAKKGKRGHLAAGIRVLLKLERQRGDLVKKWKIFKNREDMIKAAIQQSSQLSKDLEEDELATEVLGTSAVGGLDLSKYGKGSAAAKLAEDRLRPLAPRATRNLNRVQKLLREMDSHYHAAQYYVLSLLAARQ